MSLSRGMDRAIVSCLMSILAIAGAVGAQERELSLWGYMDVEFEYDTATDVSTFKSGHFNLLENYAFEQFRVFSEVEWEHGPRFEAGESEGEGEIALERAWFEYLYRDYFKVRAGKFLTPFGIYNLVHDATPTFLTTRLPLIYGKHDPFGNGKGLLYAKFYTGLQLLGSCKMKPWLWWTYTLGLGNGRGEKQFSEDNDQDKAISFRLRMEHPGGLSLGVSHYRDRNEKGFSGKARARERAYGVDLEIERSAFLLQFEYVLFRLETDGGQNDFRNVVATYGQVAYRLGEWITPILRYERFDPDGDFPGDASRRWLLGVNLSPHSRVYLKSEVLFRSSDRPAIDSSRRYLSSLSVAF